MARKLISFLILASLLLLGVCTVQLSHSLESMHVTTDHECCDFSHATHHETPEITFFGSTTRILPTLLLVLVVLIAVPIQRSTIYETPPLPNFLKRFNRGVLQLE